VRREFGDHRRLKTYTEADIRTATNLVCQD
jgi:hypothetical protein